MLKQEVVDEPASDEVEGSRMKVYMTYHIGFRVLCKLCSSRSDAPQFIL